MGMMITVLGKKIKDMRDLRQREERKANKVAQDALDSQFNKLTNQIHLLMLALKHTKEKIKFQLSDQMINELEKYLQEYKSIVKSGLVEKEMILQAETDFKTLQQNIKREWAKHYAVCTSSTISTLHVIAEIDSEKVSTCLAGIEKGSVWTTQIENFKLMEEGLAEAKKLINSLGLDPTIIAFLQKMNNGKATVMDLEDDVLRWLREESLEKRVKLSFTGSNKRS